MEIIFVFVAWILLSLAVSSYAGRKGRHEFGWFLLSLFISPLLVWIILYSLEPNEERLEEQALSGGMKKCPQCAELIKGEAKVCRYCQSDLSGDYFIG